MDLRFPPEVIAFRDEVRAFMRANLPEALRRVVAAGRKPDRAAMTAWTRTLHAKGWAVPHWPVEWGGTGWDPLRQMIFRDEIQQADAPEPLSFGVSMVGPVIYTFGNEAQKARFLPRIATLEDWWCQGFSEPGAGSDLASLTTRAERKGEHYLLNGQKTWTTLAQYADWIFVLARTDPAAKKQAGISFLLVDLRAPGVTVRPITMIDGTNEINEVFFDDVVVPVANRVGEENKGWDYARFLLANERTGQARVGLAKARLRRVRALAEGLADGNRRLIDDIAFRRRLAALEAEALVLDMTVLRAIIAESAPDPRQPAPSASVLKIRGSELQQATTELMLDALGPLAPLANAREEDDAGHAAMAAYFNLRKLSIYGGSNEIQRGIIARGLLGT